MIGKSTIARKIASLLEYGCISTDDIGLAIKTVTTAETHPRSHSMDGIDYREYYINRSVEELLADGMGMHEEMWPGIEAGIIAHADWSFPVVYEGWAMWPERVAKILDELDNVAAIWLTASEDFLEERVRSAERFYAGASDQEMMIQKYLPRNIEYNHLMMAAVGRLGLDYIEVDSTKTLEEVANSCFAALER